MSAPIPAPQTHVHARYVPENSIISAFYSTKITVVPIRKPDHCAGATFFTVDKVSVANSTPLPQLESAQVGAVRSAPH